MGIKKNTYERIEEIDTYFSEIQKYKPLSRTEEVYLAKQIANGSQEALNKLVQANLKFVVNVAKSYRYTNLSFADLIAEGNIGLIKAATKFDYTKDTKFITYAVWWIKNSIQDFIEKQNHDNEVSADDYVFDNTTKMTNDDDGCMININNYDNIDEEDFTDIQSRSTTLQELMEGLQQREIRVLEMYFGLHGNEEMKLDEIGKELNITMERVRQIKEMAIDKMKINALMSDEFYTFKELAL